jgi:hypothetical protein
VAAAAVVEWLLGRIVSFDRAREQLAGAIVRGSAHAAIEGAPWRTAPIEGAPPGMWWAPRRLVAIDRRRWRLARADDGLRWELWSVEREAWEPVPPEEARRFVHVVYGDEESRLGYGRGLLESLYLLTAAKRDLLISGIQAAERFGQGMLTVGLDRLAADPSGSTPEARASAYATAFARQRREGVIVHDSLDKVGVMSGGGEGWQIVQALLDYLDTRATILCLGANLPTEATGGGSYALALVQEGTTSALLRPDVEQLAAALDESLCELIWRSNTANLARLGLAGAERGTLRMSHDRTGDPVAFAGLVATLVGAGLPVRRDEVYRRVGLTPPGPEDDVLAPQAAAALPGQVAAEQVGP